MNTLDPNRESIKELLSSGRYQEAEWLIREGQPSPITLDKLASLPQFNSDPKNFFISPGYYAPISSWEIAQQLCGIGYNDISIVDRYKRDIEEINKNRHIKSTHLGAYAIRQFSAMQYVWCQLGQPSKMRVIDFGGGLGHHFFTLSPFWNLCSLDWIICETELVVSAGKEHYEINSLDGSSLRFSNDYLETMSSGVDLVFASCSIQYIKDYFSLLASFSSASWLLIDRVPIIDIESDLIGIQVLPRGYTDARYCGWVFSLREWLPKIKSLGCELVLDWLVPEDRWNILDLRKGSFAWSSPHDRGYLFKTNKNIKTKTVF